MITFININKPDFEENHETSFSHLLHRHFRSYPRTDYFQEFVHSRNQKRFYNSLIFSRRLLRRRVIPRISLLFNQMSSFRKKIIVQLIMRWYHQYDLPMMHFAICLNCSLLYLKYLYLTIDIIKHENLFVGPIRNLSTQWMDYDFNFLSKKSWSAIG